MGFVAVRGGWLSGECRRCGARVFWTRWGTGTGRRSPRDFWRPRVALGGGNRCGRCCWLCGFCHFLGSTHSIRFETRLPAFMSVQRRTNSLFGMRRTFCSSCKTIQHLLINVNRLWLWCLIGQWIVFWWNNHDSIPSPHFFQISPEANNQ